MSAEDLLIPGPDHGGIPRAPFVANVADFVTSTEDVDRVIQQFQEAIAKYKFMQESLQKTAANLMEKIPDIRKTLQTVEFLGARKADDPDLVVDFELNDTLYAKAEVSHTETVNIWLGANVMVEYPIPEAQEMLSERLNTAEASLKTTEENLEFIREQITTMEVNTARIYNWSVEQRRMEREGQTAEQ
ncbi:prefoldin subunit 3 [Protomyces lactucae-debilis]|uniref:Prefoldin subunit 3 n=1 Tax=Protomyces lactucae-debilis TaxID=2754530 RepID=A0A1Y2FKI9_PROLT|nr:prefoldin subunit 3 [Protomyces lactucae-debilis]ORY84483.1 prefoldin subunit 3 [Protomyces lactucae-debilis]